MKADAVTEVQPFPIVTDSSPVQSVKEPSAIVVTLSENMTVFKDVQLQKALPSIVVRVSDISRFTSSSQP